MLGLTIGAIPAVLVAAFIVKEMPLTCCAGWSSWWSTYAGLISLLYTALRKLSWSPPDAAEARW